MVRTDSEHEILAQLHQWVLWHLELKLPLPLSSALRDRCAAALHAAWHSSSQAEHKLVATLTKLGLDVQDEIIQEGYSIDVAVFWESERVAVEFVRPSRRLSGAGVRLASAIGATILKRRQLRFLGWKLIVVPYWEWNEVKSSEANSCKYILRKLKQAASGGHLGKVNSRQQQGRGQGQENDGMMCSDVG